MKTSEKTSQAPNLRQEIQRLVEAAPSSAKLAQAKADLDFLRLKREEISIVLARHEKEAAKTFEEHAKARTEALLGKREMPKLILSSELHQARIDMGDVDSAIRIRQNEVQSLVSAVSVEVRRHLKPYRQPLIARAAVALKELESVATEDAEIISAAGRAGCDTAFIGYLQIPDLNIMGGAKAWLSARRAEGYLA
jgi:hypothetical protein